MKRLAILIGLILFYPLTVFTMRVATVGLHQIPYAYVGTINTVKEGFSPYHLLLFSEKVDEWAVLYDVWSDPADGKILSEDQIVIRCRGWGSKNSSL